MFQMFPSKRTRHRQLSIFYANQSLQINENITDLVESVVNPVVSLQGSDEESFFDDHENYIYEHAN